MTEFSEDLVERLCSYLPRDHPFGGHLEIFKEQIKSRLREDSFDDFAGDKILTRTLMRVVPAGNSFELKWIYFSAQVWLNASFQAVTFLYRSGRKETSVYPFPKDPRLLMLRSHLQPHLQKLKGVVRVGGIEALRYVPRRRFTYLDVGAESQRRVVKCVRKFEVEPLYQKLSRLQALRPSLQKFSISTPLDRNVEEGCLSQTALSGPDLATLLPGENGSALMRQTAGIHAEIHRLRMDPIGEWDFAAYLEAVGRDVRWIGFLLPALADELESIYQRWKRAMPRVASDEYVFCHGDFRAPHLLVRPETRWGIIDFDGYLPADRYWEISWFLTSLKRDLPGLRAEALEGPYLEEYSSVAGQGLNRKKLDWFRMGAELHYVARSYQRDLVDAQQVAATLDLIRERADKL